MPIRLQSINADTVTVVAWHPSRQDYSPTIHLIWMGKIIASDISDQQVGGESSGWISELSIASFRSAGSPATPLLALVGETDEALEIIIDPSVEVDELSRVLNDGNSHKNWISGRTLYDVLDAGLGNRAIIELLYFDVLKRYPDNIGISNILDTVQQNRNGWKKVRQDLIKSDEYSKLTLYRHDAPGSLFSSYSIMSVEAYSEIALNNSVPIDAEMLVKETHEATVAEIYKVLLGRDVDEAGLRHHVKRLEEGGHSSVIIEILSSLESALRRNRLTC